MTLFALLGASAGRARAQSSGLVVLVRDAAELEDAQRRIAAELALRGFDITTRTASLGGEPCVTLHSLTDALAGTGGLALVSGGQEAVRIVSFDGSSRTCVEHAAPPSGDDASGLAIRAVELMRAHFIERELAAARTRRQEPRPEPTRLPVVGRRPLTLGIGMAASSPRPMGMPALAGQARAAWLFGRFSLQAEASPLASGLAVAPGAMDTASADVRVRSGSLALARSFTHGAWDPFAGIAAGVAHVEARGVAVAPDEARDRSVWTPFLGMRVGARRWLGSRLLIGAELGVDLWRSSPVVQIRAVDRRELGNPVVSAALWVGCALGEVGP